MSPMPKVLLIDPTFAVPLNEQHLYDLGVIAVIWGQIDFILDEIVAHVHAFDREQRDRFLTDKMMGTKVDMLASDYSRLPKKLHPQAKDLVARINNLKPRRNAAFHGVWGWRLEKRSQTLTVAAHHPKSKNNPLKPIQLRGMLEEMIACSKVAGQLMADLQGLPFTPAVKFCWGGDLASGGPPEWLKEGRGQIQKGRPPESRRRPRRDARPKAGPG